MSIGDNKGFWQRFARVYGPAVRKREAKLYDSICDRIRPQLTEDMRVLELACGSGQLTYPLAGCVAQWEATDFSPRMIGEASKWPHSDRLRFSVQDAGNLPFEHATFDAVVISNALHLMPHPERALKEIRRVLRPDGLLFAPTFVHGGQPKGTPRRLLMKLAGFRVYHRWTGREYLRFLEKRGFSVLDAALLPGDWAPLCYVAARKTE